MDGASQLDGIGVLENSVAEAMSGYQFPTTFAQRRLWFLDQLDRGNISYLIPWSIRMKGALHLEALERSLNEIVRRHEVLRTTFAEVNGEPVQVVAESLAVRLAVTNLSYLPVEEREQEAVALAAEEARRPLNLRDGPLVRGSVIRLGEDDHVLLLTLHHIVFDGWSRRIFARELAALYEAFADGRPSPLAELRLQYADCAVWQRKHFAGKNFQKHLDYWKKQLEGAPASLELPVDRPRPAIQTTHGATKPLALPKTLSDDLLTLARDEGASLFMTLLAGFQALLYRYTGQDDLLIGAPIANRNRAQTEEIIGLFANTLVLRTRLEGNPSFRELLGRTKETALGAYAHQDMPFERLVEELNPERSLAHNPLFQVLFSLQNAARQPFELRGLELKQLDGTAVTAKFDISMYLTESADRVRGRVEYNTDLFDGETIERLIGHYETLLKGAVANPELRIGELPVLTGRERKQMIEEWNATEAEYPALCVHEWIEKQVERSPGAIACCDETERLSYRELNERANQLAHFLELHGAGPGERVGVYLDRSVRLMVALLGVQKSGAAYVPIDPGYPAERVAAMVEDAMVTAIVTQQSLRGSLPVTAAPSILIDGDAKQIAKQPRTNVTANKSPDRSLAVAAQLTSPIDEGRSRTEQGDFFADTNPSSGAKPKDPIYVIFTSGSTGRPKGVEVTHRAVVNLLASMARELDMGPQDVFPALASYAFDMSIPELYLALVTGGCTAIGRARLAADGKALAQFLKTVGATVVHVTPTAWSLLLEAGFTGRGLKRAIGAEALPQELCTRLLEAEPSLYNFYGPTETTVWSTLHCFTSTNEAVLIGRPLANTQVYVLDANLEPVPAGVVGELYIGGDGVANGYWNREDLTQERFLADPFRPGQRFYRTGDRARFLRDGRVQFLGRNDHQVKIRGYRIELGEIETALAKHPDVKECVVMARQDTPGTQRLVAYVVSRAGTDSQSAKLREYLKRLLPDYSVPHFFVFLEALPLTANRKIDRKGLPAPEGAVETGADAVAPRDECERKLLDIWVRVLGIRSCGIADNFFELGGHSLLLVRLATMIEREFGRPVPLSVLFQSPTVEKVAAYLRDEHKRDCSVFIPFNETGTGPALFCVHSVTGDVNSYRYLAPLLDREQRFYGIELPQEFRKPECVPTIEKLAQFYVDKLLVFEPKGPYLLGGWSAGSPVALEMAQQLRERGHAVDLLVAIDAAAPNTGGTTSRKNPMFYWKLVRNVPGWLVEDFGVNFSLQRTWQRVKRRVSGFARKATANRRTPEQVAQDRINAFLGGGEYSESARAFMGAFFLKMRKYVPKPYGGRVLLFKAKTEPLLYLIEADQRWKKLATDLEIFRMAGTHVSIVEERHVAELAAHLNKRLRECRERAMVETATVAMNCGEATGSGRPAN